MTRKTPNGLMVIVMIAAVLIGFVVIGLLIFDPLIAMTNSQVIAYALLGVTFYLWFTLVSKVVGWLGWNK